MEKTLADGSPVTPDHLEIDPATGMQKAYVVLSQEERAKGFVRPVRRSYRHRGLKLPANLRDLSPQEKEKYAEFGWVKYEDYEDQSKSLGRYWTLDELARAQRGCGAITTMGQAIAETYAREPRFYGKTFCCACQAHYPIEEFTWVDNPDQQVGE